MPMNASSWYKIVERSVYQVGYDNRLPVRPIRGGEKRKVYSLFDGPAGDKGAS